MRFLGVGVASSKTALFMGGWNDTTAPRRISCIVFILLFEHPRFPFVFYLNHFFVYLHFLFQLYKDV